MSATPASDGSIGPVTVRILPARLGIAAVVCAANDDEVYTVAAARPSANEIPNVIFFMVLYSHLSCMPTPNLFSLECEQHVAGCALSNSHVARRNVDDAIDNGGAGNAER